MRNVDAQMSSIDNKMPSEAPMLPTQTEKPHHYTYLKEFRTQQCPLFLQHKCTQHRPFTCFHWHFMNQRRRRPIRRRDGVFNYSPDIYCTKYDETTGMCPDGDDCPYLHRTAGDTERRYHLRYYKTGTCVHETDARGHCVKNGPHCAFAHGAHDLRPPVYDIRELQAMELADKGVESPVGGTPSSLEKERIMNEDPKWNDTNFVLANYKTEPCKRPPRLCRQGYACPSYHNSRDRRRSPRKYKYRSTPCPSVKHGDDWGDPTQCDGGDNCPYCHTRTEQQFHPEIYKSTKCNDMVQTGYCPRGPFCAFAHVEQEMTTARDLPSSAENSLAAFVTNALPSSQISPLSCSANDSLSAENNSNSNATSKNSLTGLLKSTNHSENSLQHPHLMKTNKEPGPIGKERANSLSNHTNVLTSVPTMNNSSSSLSSSNSMLHEQLQKVRSASTSSGSILSSEAATIMHYMKAPGSEREDHQTWTAKLRQQLQSIDNDPSIDVNEKTKRKQNLLLLHSLNGGTSSSSPLGVSMASSIGSTPTTPSSTMSPQAAPFYPAGETVESVIGNALDDLTLEDFDLSSIDKELERDNDTNSVSSSISAGFSASGYLGATSVPVSIPIVTNMQRGSVGSLSQSPSSPLGSLPPPFVPQHIQQQEKQEQQLQMAAAAFLSHPNPGKYSAPGYQDYNSMSPRTNATTTVTGGGGGGAPASPLISSSAFSNANGEIQRLRTELEANKAKLASWEEGIAQARSACDAWKKEADEYSKKAKISDEDKLAAIRSREEALQQVSKLQLELEKVCGGPFLRCLHRVNELESLPLSQLKQLQQSLKQDLNTLDKIVYQHTAMKCLVCQEKNRSVAIMPCNHYVLCDVCATKQSECPYCHLQITQRSSIVLPL